jgi:3-deoxy-D-manno-octulosonate 8-phosphate phosphatase (KDO 8-P phosphatase)
VTRNSRILDAASLAELVQTIRMVAFDFDGVFTDNLVYVFEDGREAVRCNRSDGLGLSKLKELGIIPVIISTETNPVVGMRSRKLKIHCVQACSDKREALDELARDNQLSLSQIAFVGNDVNDIPCLAAVGLPIVVQDSHPDVLPYARYRTNLPGGFGAVREVCDLFGNALSKKSE